MTEKKKERELACFRPGKYNAGSPEEFEILIIDDFSILRIGGQDCLFRADNGSYAGSGPANKIKKGE